MSRRCQAHAACFKSGCIQQQKSFDTVLGHLPPDLLSRLPPPGQHPGELVAKVGYFGVKSTKVLREQMRDAQAPNLLKSVALAPGVLKCGAAPNPHRRYTDGRLRKKVFDPRREQSC